MVLDTEHRTLVGQINEERVSLRLTCAKVGLGDAEEDPDVEGKELKVTAVRGRLAGQLRESRSTTGAP